MKHSLKHTLITLLSILAMLMTSYVSSVRAMSGNSMPFSVMSSSDMPCHTRKIDFLTTSTELVQISSRENCHSMVGASLDDLDKAASDTMTHCQGANSTVDNCCPSVCSGVPYPIDTLSSLGMVSVSRALHQSLKLDLAVAYIDGIQRPPSL